MSRRFGRCRGGYVYVYGQTRTTSISGAFRANGALTATGTLASVGP